MEIKIRGVWSTVCHDYWDLNDAQVVCRMLNLPRATAAPRNAFFGVGRGPIWLDRMQCAGHETSLLNCQHRGISNNYCGHSQDASVICGNFTSKLFCRSMTVNIVNSNYKAPCTRASFL